MPNELQQIISKDNVMPHTMGALMGDEPDFKPGDNLEVPNERGMINIWATAMWAYLKVLDNPEAVPHVIVGGDHAYGDEKRAPLGQVMGDAMVRKFQEHSIPGKVTYLKNFVDSDGQMKPIVDTYGEIQAYLAVAKRMSLKNGATVAALTHTTSINQLLNRYDKVPGLNAHSFAAEAILTNLPKKMQTHEYLNAVKRVFKSNDEVQFFVQEAIKNVFYLIPGGAGERFINRKAQASRIVSTVGEIEEKTITIPTVS
ncbi:hypothetical protein BH10PAT2_BH10PAT2_2910 [soil metagenome]